MKNIRRLALVLLLCTGAGHSTAAEPFVLPESANDVASVSWATGNLPLHCAEISREASVCTWRTAEGVHIVCQFNEAPREGTARKRCSIQKDNESNFVWPITPSNGGKRKRIVNTRQRTVVQQESIAAFTKAATPYGVSSLLGTGPNQCAHGETLACTWVAARKTPGYPVAARAADAAGKKVRVLCRFSRTETSQAECQFALADQVAEQAQ